MSILRELSTLAPMKNTAAVFSAKIRGSKSGVSTRAANMAESLASMEDLVKNLARTNLTDQQCLVCII